MIRGVARECSPGKGANVLAFRPNQPHLISLQVPSCQLKFCVCVYIYIYIYFFLYLYLFNYHLYVYIYMCV